MLERIQALIIKEFIQIIRDPRTLSPGTVQQIAAGVAALAALNIIVR